MFQQSRRLAWMFLCIASLLLFSTLPALAQVSQSQDSQSIDRTSGADAAPRNRAQPQPRRCLSSLSSGCACFPCGIQTPQPWALPRPQART